MEEYMSTSRRYRMFWSSCCNRQCGTLVAHQHAVRAKREPRLVVEELDRVQVARDPVRRRVELERLAAVRASVHRPAPADGPGLLRRSIVAVQDAVAARVDLDARKFGLDVRVRGGS